MTNMLKAMRSIARCRLLTAFLFLPLPTLIAHAQQIEGTPGSPSATTTIDGKQLPPSSFAKEARARITANSFPDL